MNREPTIKPQVRNAGESLRRLKREDGAELLEYSLVFILFMTLIFGIAGFGHMLYAYHFVSNAAREATRFAAVHGKTCGADADGGSCTPTGGPASPGNTSPITTYVSSITPPGIDTTKVTVTPTWPVQTSSPTICSAAVNGVGGPFPNYPGCTVQVQVQYSFNYIFPIISTSPLTLTSTSEMIIAH